MKRSPIVNTEPIAFVDTSLSSWPAKRPDGTRLVVGDLIFLDIHGQKSPSVYMLDEPDRIGNGDGDAWTFIDLGAVEEWMIQALMKASPVLYEKWVEAGT